MNSKVLFMSLLLLTLTACERRLIYFPPTYVPFDESLQSTGFQYWPDTDGYRGFILSEPPESAAGTVIFFHGNGTLASHRFNLALALKAHGFQVLLLEFPGYGGRDGSPSEPAIVDDAVATVQLAAQQLATPLYFWGESIGAGAAASVITALAKEENPVNVDGVVMQVPFDSLRSVAKHHYRFLPTGWIRDKYNSVANLGNYKGRVAVLLAGSDTVVPAELGERLYQSINTTKKRWVFERAGHIIPIERAPSVLDEVVAFIKG